MWILMWTGIANSVGEGAGNSYHTNELAQEVLFQDYTQYELVPRL